MKLSETLLILGIYITMCRFEVQIGWVFVSVNVLELNLFCYERMSVLNIKICKFENWTDVNKTCRTSRWVIKPWGTGLVSSKLMRNADNINGRCIRLVIIKSERTNRSPLPDEAKIVFSLVSLGLAMIDHHRIIVSCFFIHFRLFLLDEFKRVYLLLVNLSI